MQKIIITGNLGADATIDTYGQDTVIRFRVAVNSRFTNRAGQPMQETTWYSCSYWNANANFAAALLKGRRIYVEGIPRTRVYQDERTGQWNVSNDVRVLMTELQDANPVNRSEAQIPAGAVVNQPTQTAPDQYQMAQRQAPAAAPATIEMPERVTQPVVQEQQQSPMFPNAAPQLPESPLNVATEEKVVHHSAADLPY